MYAILKSIIIALTITLTMLHLLTPTLVYAVEPVFKDGDYFIYKATIYVRSYLKTHTVKGESINISVCKFTYWLKTTITNVNYPNVTVEVMALNYTIGECNMSRSDVEEQLERYKSSVSEEVNIDKTPTREWLLQQLTIEYGKGENILNKTAPAEILFVKPGYTGKVDVHTTTTTYIVSNEPSTTTYYIEAIYNKGVLFNLDYKYTMLYSTRMRIGLVVHTIFTNFTVTAEFELKDTSVKELMRGSAGEEALSQTTNPFKGWIAEKGTYLIIISVAALVLAIIAYIVYKKISVPPPPSKPSEKPSTPPPPPPPPP